MSQQIEFNCPSCQKRLKVPPISTPKKIACPKCNHKFVFNPTAKSSSKPPPPLNPPSQPTEDEQWHILDGNGQQYGPFDFNDVQNYASQGRLSLDTSVRHQTRTKNKWVSVTRVPEITELMQTAASLQIQLAGASTASYKAVNPDFPRTATVPILVSAICNILVALIWIGTCFGIPLGFACIALCVCEFVVFSKRESYNREQFRSVTLWLGIFEIIVGLINIVSFVCGIVVLVTRPPKNA